MPSPWWTPERHNDRRPALHARAALLRALRNWFHAQSFLEVEPHCLQTSPGNETHLHGFASEHIRPDESRTPVYLHTSPEFAMKKVLAAGEEKIFALARVFRNRESGPLHHSEFTMLEWYRARVPYRDVMEDCCALLGLAAKVRGSEPVSFRGITSNLSRAPEKLTVSDAFMRHAKIDLLATLNDDPRTGNRDALAMQATDLSLSLSDSDTWSDIFSKVLTAHIEPHLGRDCPTLLIDYPLPEAALARQSARDPRVGERFELYCCGLELANGFGELTDATEQRRRFEAAMEEKQNIYGERYPIDEDFLSALEIMPEASGVALGFDRLVLLTTGAERLDQVVWTPPKQNDKD